MKRDLVRLDLALGLVWVSWSMACDPGSYRPANASECVPCVPGFYCTGSDVFPCPLAPEKTHSPPGSHSLQNCTCKAGFYSLDHSRWNCWTCQAGSYCDGSGSKKCPALSRSKEQSSSLANCTCVPGSVFSGGECQLCQSTSFCPGGEAAAVACPLHSNSLPGSSVVEHCHCLPPFIMVHDNAFACVHLNQAQDTFSHMHAQLPEISVHGLKSALSVNVDELSAEQRQAVVARDNLVCTDGSGAMLTCPATIEGAMINGTHALVSFKNVMVDPKFMTLIFDVFKEAQLSTTVYVQRQEVWRTGFGQHAKKNGKMITADATVLLKSLQSVQRYHEDLPIMVSSLRAAIYKQRLANESSVSVQVTVKPSMLRLSYEWIHTDDRVLSCLAPAGAQVNKHDIRSTVSSEYQLFDVGEWPCPTVEQFQCMMSALGDAFHKNLTALQCAAQVSVFFEGDSDYALYVDLRTIVADVFDFEDRFFIESEVGVTKFWSMSTDHDDMLQRADEIVTHLEHEKTSTPQETTLFDSGLQSSGFWLVSFLHTTSRGFDVDWNWLLLAPNFSQEMVEWGLTVSRQQRVHFATALSLLGHSVTEALVMPSAYLSLSSLQVQNLTDVTFTVHGYGLGTSDMQSISHSLCVFATCPSCGTDNVSVVLHSKQVFRWDSVSYSNVTAILQSVAQPSSVSCNATHRGIIFSPGDANLDGCDATVFFVEVVVFVPFPPEVVSYFILDLVISSVSANLTKSDVWMEGTDGGTLVHAGLVVSSVDACLNTRLMEETMLRALFASVWPYVAIPTSQALAQHVCRVTCAQASVPVSAAQNLAPAWSDDTLYDCAYLEQLEIVPESTEALVHGVLSGASWVWGEPRREVLQISTGMSYQTTCPGTLLQEAFDNIYPQEYTQRARNITDLPTALQADASGWNAREKSSCVNDAGRAKIVSGCAHAVNMTLSENQSSVCLRLDSLNARISDFRVRDYLASFSPVLLPLEAATLRLSSRTESGPIYVPRVVTDSNQALMDALSSDKSVQFSIRRLLLVQHRLSIQWHTPFSKQAEASDLQQLSTQLPAELDAAMSMKNTAIFHMYTTSSLHMPPQQSDILDAELEFISSFVQNLHLDVFTIKNMSHTPLKNSAGYSVMTKQERSLVDDAHKEIDITISIDSFKSCAEVSEVLASMAFIPMFLIPKRVHMIMNSLQCSSSVDISYPSESCSSLFDFSVSVGRIQGESCVVLQNFSEVTIVAEDDTSFFQAMDIFGSDYPRHLAQFRQHLSLCEYQAELVEMIQEAVSAFGKYGFIDCLQGPQKRMPFLAFEGRHWDELVVQIHCPLETQSCAQRCQSSQKARHCE